MKFTPKHGAKTYQKNRRLPSDTTEPRLQFLAWFNYDLQPNNGCRDKKQTKSFTPVRVWLHEWSKWFVGAVFHISGCRCLREKCWVELSVHCSIWWQSRDLINTNSTSVSISRRGALALASTRTIFSWLWSGLDSHPVWNTALQLNNPNVLTSLSHSINIHNQWLWQH